MILIPLTRQEMKILIDKRMKEKKELTELEAKTDIEKYYFLKHIKVELYTNRPVIFS